MNDWSTMYFMIWSVTTDRSLARRTFINEDEINRQIRIPVERAVVRQRWDLITMMSQALL